MLEFKQKQLKVCVARCKKTPDIAISLCIPYQCNKHCLQTLKNKRTSDTMYNGCEASALAYALYLCIYDKMAGSPLEMSKSRVSSVNCSSQNNHFIINWNTQGSISTLRRTIAFSLQCLNPSKLYSRYAENMKMLGGKGDKSVFATCANVFPS